MDSFHDTILGIHERCSNHLVHAVQHGWCLGHQR